MAPVLLAELPNLASLDGANKAFADAHPLCDVALFFDAPQRAYLANLGGGELCGRGCVAE